MQSIIRSPLFNMKNESQHIDKDTTKMLVHAFVLSRVDYCTAILVFLPAKSIDRLQFVINCAARLISKKPCTDLISPTINEFGWLRASSRIAYHMLLLVHLALNSQSPEYIAKLISKYQTQRSLRSSDDVKLNLGQWRTSIGRRSFSCAAPALWNDLPANLRTTVSRTTFASEVHRHLLSMQ